MFGKTSLFKTARAHVCTCACLLLWGGYLGGGCFRFSLIYELYFEAQTDKFLCKFCNTK